MHDMHNASLGFLDSNCMAGANSVGLPDGFLNHLIPNSVLVSRGTPAFYIDMAAILIESENSGSCPLCARTPPAFSLGCKEPKFTANL